ncbi:MAG TPA: glycosyltransferase family 4 protein [Candidatus Moranbacteria bacterium]|jgi:glycosyltransferase involved in cell wall biosynthesis|nr:glycosyltransferase family 4 protein [Candidatus Moranbacteria bacterium]HOF42811.1 glycosyltransferase family 4 protein [Candidatus Moranbacteria bacterium]HPX94632.1 glycosyltransferase family 4 protein [Candidatus Moranbacteria bacterium]HQB59787.1 glycosyltransferase family 4 protein [Candidatus Moranbacteria bacterium]
MRVLFFNYEFPPLGGGAGNASYYLLEEFTKIPDLQVDLVTSSVDDEQHVLQMGDNIRIYRIPIRKDPGNMHYQSLTELLRYRKRAYKFAKNLIKNNEYDLTHSFFSVPCGHISYKLWKKYKIPYIISLRGADVPGYSERFSLLYGFIVPTIKKIWRNAYFVIANSQGLRELALKSAPDKEIGVICNGINVGDFFPNYEKRDLSYFTIVCVSRITPRKGIRFLIQAFKVLSARYSNIRMLIVGDGNEKPSLEQLTLGLGLEDKVVFTGAVPHKDVLQYYHKANVFVLPSLNEGMSNTMLEALACGLPLIATDTGGTKEILADGRNGFIVRMRDSNDLAEKLEKLVLDPSLVERMGQESLRIAKELSWESVAKGYVELYQKTINLRKIRNH